MPQFPAETPHGVPDAAEPRVSSGHPGPGRKLKVVGLAALAFLAVGGGTGLVLLGGSLSAPDESGIVPVTTATTSTAPSTMTVGTYNVRYAKARPTGLEMPWSQRVSVVAEQIKSSGAVVVGLNESDNNRSGHNQTNDLVSELGGSWRSESWSVTQAELDGATSNNGVAIIYDSSALTPVRAGAILLPRPAGTQQRYAYWQVFTEPSTASSFVFVATHFEEDQDSVGSLARNQQATAVAELALDQASLAPGTGESPLPSIIAGDLNTFPDKMPDNEAYHLITEDFYDPIGQGSDPGAAEPLSVSSRYSSFVGFTRTPTPAAEGSIGRQMDYLLMSKQSTPHVVRYETLANIDSSGRLRWSTLPSDHLMVVATLALPLPGPDSEGGVR